MIEIDGSEGEGGGQILRSALALSLCTAQPFRIFNIRARRPKPGLMRQHLTAVQAAATIGHATVVGAEVGSCELTFRPGTVTAGDYDFAIGTAGSCTLVLQTILPPLLTAKGRSRVRITGGTHNKAAPPVDFLQRAFLPLIERMGPRVTLELVRHGFYPRGGGEIVVTVSPTSRLERLSIPERGALVSREADAYVAGVPLHVASRELQVVGRMLSWPEDVLHVRGLPGDMGPGNALTISVGHEQVIEVFTAFGEKGVSAEAVATSAAAQTQAYLAGGAAVGPHLADQLLLPMALSGGGTFSTTSVTDHFRSQVVVTQRFLSIEPTIDGRGSIIIVRL